VTSFKTFEGGHCKLRATARESGTYWTMTWAYIQGCGEHV
jgi:hypothetical protein